MKQLLMMGALVLMASMAQASDAADRNSKTFRFDFSCEFRSNAAVEGDNHWDQPDSNKSYEASARVFADVSNDHDISLESIPMSQNLNNYISISRDGSLIFADSAVLFSNVHNVVITGSNGVSPSISVKRDNKPLINVGDKPMCYDSWLHFGDRSGPSGQCCVKARPVVLGEIATDLN